MRGRVCGETSFSENRTAALNLRWLLVWPKMGGSMSCEACVHEGLGCLVWVEQRKQMQSTNKNKQTYSESEFDHRRGHLHRSFIAQCHTNNV